MLPLHLLTSPATAPKYLVPRRHQQYGFSLLELVVVMGILAIFASVSMTFVGEKDVQQRYNESLEKLTMVKRNFLSVDKFQGQMVMHGFFIDNGMINDGVEKEAIINNCVVDGDMSVEDKEDEIKKDKCILKTAVSTSFRTLLNLRRLPATPTTPNSPQLTAAYKSFSFISEIHLLHDEISPKEEHNLLIGAGLYKGIRPGAFDLSQYQDANNEIRDAWGDEFKLNSKFDSNTIQIGIESEGYKYLDKPENNSGTSKSKVDISYSDLVVNVDVNLTLKIGEKENDEDPEFRFAFVSFDNNTKCREPDNSCWTTQISDTLVLTNLPDTESFIGSEKFKSNLTAGSHVVVLLEKVEDKKPTAWKIHNSDLTGENISHTFEYLHIFPGRPPPDPITMSIP